MSSPRGARGAVDEARLDIAQLRDHAAAVYDGVKSIDGIRLRQRPESGGRYRLLCRLRDERQGISRPLHQELRGRKVPASTLTGSVLLPIEESVINKRARHGNWPRSAVRRARASSMARRLANRRWLFLTDLFRSAWEPNTPRRSTLISSTRSAVSTTLSRDVP